MTKFTFFLLLSSTKQPNILFHCLQWITQSLCYKSNPRLQKRPTDHFSAVILFYPPKRNFVSFFMNFKMTALWSLRYLWVFRKSKDNFLWLWVDHRKASNLKSYPSSSNLQHPAVYEFLITWSTAKISDVNFTQNECYFAEQWTWKSYSSGSHS